MKGSVPIKMARLMTHLITHPEYLPRYVNHNLRSRKTPLELEIPWFSYAAIDFLMQFLKPGMEVYEYGSGGSTLFFARQAKMVWSTEDNAEWYQRVSEKLKEKGVENVELQLCPYDFKNPTLFETSAYLNAIPKRQFDVIVIDGSEEWDYVRPICFRHAEPCVRPGGIIVVDDSWRYPDLRARNKAKAVRTFQSVGPFRPGVTSTDIFFY